MIVADCCSYSPQRNSIPSILNIPHTENLVVEMSTLSERFSQLKGTTGAIKKPGDKTVQRKIEQASSRNQKTQQRRGIPINGTVPKGKKAPTKVKGNDFTWQHYLFVIV